MLPGPNREPKETESAIYLTDRHPSHYLGKSIKTLTEKMWTSTLLLSHILAVYDYKRTGK